VSPISPEANQRRRLLLGGGSALLAVLAAALVLTLVLRDSAEVEAAERFAAAWQEQDFGAMHAELTPDARSEHSAEKLERTHRAAQRVATVTGIGAGAAGGPTERDGVDVVTVPLELTTRAFGTISAELAIPVDDGGVAWSESLSFPGLNDGERLERRTRAPRRAAILARDRSPLAEGALEARSVEPAAANVVGEIGDPSGERAREMLRQGFPEGLSAGSTGLELAFDGILAGTPGGSLLAAGPDGRRELARSQPVRGKPVRTTLDSDLQAATVAALGDSFGGIAVLDAANGQVRALAGVAFSAPQPPGSTFKVITTVAGLEEGVTEPDREYPPQTGVTIEGWEISNAHDESCGGTLVESFADSCNTVFAPLGVEVGSDALVDAAERFGFNEPPSLYNVDAIAAAQPPASTIPDPLGSELEIAVSAIGQGKLLATPLQLASVAQTIANEGRRSPTALVRDPELGPPPDEVEVTSPEIAGEVAEMMVEVVRSGTGTAASLPDAVVAGKTGTAEIGPKPGQEIDPDNPNAEPEQAVNAWFTAYAPARRPRLAVAVMLVDADADGGEVAAPMAREVLAAGL
jgi:penicillin-binding protein A